MAAAVPAVFLMNWRLSIDLVSFGKAQTGDTGNCRTSILGPLDVIIHEAMVLDLSALSEKRILRLRSE
jgi:hypothetical protein